MNYQFTLKIPKRSQPLWLIWFIVFYPFGFGLFNDLLGLPNAIRYLLDIAWIMLLLLAVMNLSRKRIFIEKSSVFVYLMIGSFLLLTFIVYLFNFQSPFYYLWGIRNNFRFYIAFIAFILFLVKEDIEDFLNKLDIIFWINALVCFIQYFVLGFKQDFLGGLFGVEKGCNGYLNIFLVIITTKSVVYYLNKKESIWLLFSKVGVSLISAALAELKFFFVEFVGLLIVSVLISSFSVRKALLIISGIIGAVLFTGLIGVLFPYFSDFFNVESILLSVTEGGYSGEDQVNRLTTIPLISERFLNEPLENLFGLGLGNCDTAAYDFIKTPFYMQYSFLRYHWFSTAWIYLETGFVGLTLYFSFFRTIFFYSLKRKKENFGRVSDVMLCQITAIVSVMAILITIYNSSLRSEAGYMMFFALCFPFVVKKENSI